MSDTYAILKVSAKGGVYATPKKGVGSSWEGVVVDLKCMRVCRIFVKKRRSGRIVAKEIYGGRWGGGVRQNLIRGIGAVDAKNAGWGMPEEG